MHPPDGFTGDYQPLNTHVTGPLTYDYKATRDDVLNYMAELGYTAMSYLGYDHEEHWYFS